MDLADLALWEMLFSKNPEGFCLEDIPLSRCRSYERNQRDFLYYTSELSEE
jgi:hypothetical protein